MPVEGVGSRGPGGRSSEGDLWEQLRFGGGDDPPCEQQGGPICLDTAGTHCVVGA